MSVDPYMIVHVYSYVTSCVKMNINVGFYNQCFNCHYQMSMTLDNVVHPLVVPLPGVGLSVI